MHSHRPRIAVDGRMLRRQATGIHQYFVRGVHALIDGGADVTLLANYALEQWQDLVPGTRLIGFGRQHNLSWEQRDLPRALAEHHFDVYWAPGNLGIPLRKVAGTATVVTVHDLVPLRLPRMYMVPDPRFAASYLVRVGASLGRSDHVLTGTHASARDIRKFSGRTATVVPSYLGPRRGDADATLLPAALRGRTYVVYTGGLDPRKNVGALLTAFARVTESLPEVALALVGPGFDYFGTRIAELGLSDRIVMTGYLDDATRDAVVAGARVLVYPSLYEGFGLPIIEAFEFGVPVVTSDIPVFREIAGDAARYVDPRSPASIASGIVEMLDPVRAAAMRTAVTGRLDSYRPELTGQALWRYFEGIVATGAPRKSATGRMS